MVKTINSMYTEMVYVQIKVYYIHNNNKKKNKSKKQEKDYNNNNINKQNYLK